MSYTGHHDKTINNEPIANYLYFNVYREARHRGIEPPSVEQIALVAYELRMHAILEHAAHYDQSELGKPNEITKYWPIQSSIGRFLRDSAQITLDEVANKENNV